MTADRRALLALRGVSRHFGGIKAVDELDLQIHEGEIVGLIGPNGSGKSTTVNLITGLFPVSSGRIELGGRDITTLPTHRRMQHGVARTFQNIRLFGQLTVWQNLWVAQNGAVDRSAGSFLGRWLGGRRGVRDGITSLLEFSALGHKKDELAANLSFGEQRRLELARALATNPRLILLDEPAAGMNREEVDQLRERILAIRGQGVAVMLIEHVVELVMGVTDRIAVLNFGRKIADAEPRQVQCDEAVQRAYLGGA